MHTRRVGAFLVGAILLGTVLMPFILTQSVMTAERILGSPAPQVQKEFEEIGPEVMRQILRHQALELNRHITESWEVMQIGLAGALLATSLLTSHRSRFVMGGAAVILGLVLYMHFGLTPHISSVSRSYDFLPVTAAARERAAVKALELRYSVASVFKIAVALLITARLLFDRYDWKAKLLGQRTPSVKRVRRRRRSRRSTSAGEEAASTGGGAAVGGQVDPIDHA